jgi:hypothetical protein
MVKNIFRLDSAGALLYTFKRIVLLAGILLVFSCDFFGNLPGGESGLTVILPGASGGRSGLSRSVLSDGAIGSLVYKVTFTGPGGEVIERTAEGGSISLVLEAGAWVIKALAYKPGNIGGTVVGTGTVTVTVVPGRNQSVSIPMYVDPAYEAGLTDIYIHNEAELRRIGTDFSIDGTYNFFLERNIVLTQPWTPIGNDTTPFKAVFIGQGHSITISGFSPGALNGMYLGLFGKIDNAIINELTIVYDNLTASSTYPGSQYLGGLAGRTSNNTRIDNVHVKGSINYTTNALDIGGLVGAASGSFSMGNHTLIVKSSFAGTLNGNGVQTIEAGGILGAFNSNTDNAVIRRSYTAGTINAASSANGAYAGGIAGGGAFYALEDCYSTANVTASAPLGGAYAGGIIGDLFSGSTTFSRCYYALGTVTAAGSTMCAGGIAGRSANNIENCVALGAAVIGSGSSTVGGITGDHWAGTETNNYAASDQSIIRGLPGGSAKDGITMYASTAFQGSANQSMYTTTLGLGWTFNDPESWGGFIASYYYPVLYWQMP